MSSLIPSTLRLYSVDVKPVPRPYATCLQDRHFVHRSTPIPGQKPVTIGHAYAVYAVLAYLPEKESPHAPPWALSYDAERVPSTTSYVDVARNQCQEGTGSRAATQTTTSLQNRS